MTNSTIIRSLIVSAIMCAASVNLSGCIAVDAAAAITSATVGTVASVGRAISSAAYSTSNAVTRTVQQIPAQMMYGPYPNRQIYIPLNSPRRVTQTAATQQARAMAPRPVKRTPAKPKSKERQNILEVLPPETLDLMTKDELILQSMVQLEALNTTKDEVIFWDLEGHAGTATTKPEHRMGTFTCRDITETIKLDDAEDAKATQSTATACRTEGVGWSLSF